MDDSEHYGQEMPVQDDGWWASVLAEEEAGQEPLLTEKKPPVDAAGKPPPEWERAMRLYRQDEIVSMHVTGFNRGGLLVDGDGLSGFVPCSHLVNSLLHSDDGCREDCLAAYVGGRLRLKIIECVPEEGRLVFSERAARVEAGKRPELFHSIQAGQRLAGEVTNVTDFGVFVDLGGVEGLIHISELSWGRVAHPGQVCKIGQPVEVLVMDVSPERCRIALSLKRLKHNPWEAAQEKYPMDAIVPAVVTTLVPYGAFARLEEGLEGLIHASEIPILSNRAIKDVLSPGQSVQVRILQVDAGHQRLGLSMRLE
jgi:small subunit ribosomal protein S1